MILIEDAIAKNVEDVAKAHERYLLNFFGSIKEAKEHAHLFVFEVSDSVIEGKSSSGDPNDIRIQISQSYRLRRKTEEELLAEIDN
jgi:hypothetical protein